MATPPGNPSLETAQKSHLVDLLPSFTTADVTYKTIESHPVEATLFIPQDLTAEQKAQPRPVILRYHGGGWMTGSRFSWEWMTRWTLEFALQHGAVIVIPDYRLMPEATGAEILSDLADVVRWLPGNLANAVAGHGLTVDLGKTLVMGESAGGWCAMETGLLMGTGIGGFPASGESPVRIKAVLSQFGALEIRHHWLSVGRPVPESSVLPSVPIGVLDKHIASVKAGETPSIVTGAQLPYRLDLSSCSTTHGRTYNFIGTAPELNPLQVLNIVKGKKNFPPTWAYHGTDDTILHYEGTTQFVAEAKAVFGSDIPIKETLIPGEHGVGLEVETRNEGWVKEGLDWLELYWP